MSEARLGVGGEDQGFSFRQVLLDVLVDVQMEI